MSVQVRRRREAASFLSTYVGAQGELLVDTTNNRVQVHDGATPGGWPAAAVGDLPGRNALLNGNFSVNQRAYASGGALAANAYAHDRWKAGTAGAYTFAQVAPDTIVTITAGTLVQAVDAPNVTAAAWWLTWTGTAQARVWQGAASGAFSAGTPAKVAGVTLNALLVTGLAPGTITAVEFGAGTLGLAQFEAALPNAGPTRFERRHGETALCQRYFQSGYGSGVAPGAANAVPSFSCLSSGSSYQPVASFTFPVAMRAVPTVTTYSPFTGASGKIGRNAYQTQDVPSYCQAISNATVTIGVLNAATNSGEFLVVNYTANAEI